MEKSLVFSPRVIKSLKSLPQSEKGLITTALTKEFILGEDPMSALTPFQSILYTMIRFYVQRDNPHLAC